MAMIADCAGDLLGDCAHMYVKVSSSSAKCMYCGHITRTSAHKWKGSPNALICGDCLSSLVLSG